MLWTLGTVLALAAAGVVYLAVYFRWERRHTAGMAYFGQPSAQRRALKRKIAWYSLPAQALLGMVAVALRRRSTMPSFAYQGVSGPPRVSGPEIFARARNYRPEPHEVFVATQMRSGTTWMQQLVYEILMRGCGDLSDRGHGHLRAVSPWIDGFDGVPLERAPRVGEKPTRIVKTHLPTSLCPFGDEAKYIYVARHPVDCFASIVDFHRAMLGPLVPSVAALADWFCSERMYWLPWPRHVDGWWQWAASRDNVLFIHYEAMKADFAAVRDQVARFLGYALTPDERQRIDERCSFRYMKEHEEVFEMAPPTMFSVRRSFLARGETARHEAVPPEIRGRILDYCRAGLVGTTYPAGRFYPDLAAPAQARAARPLLSAA